MKLEDVKQELERWRLAANHPRAYWSISAMITSDALSPFGYQVTFYDGFDIRAWLGSTIDETFSGLKKSRERFAGYKRAGAQAFRAMEEMENAQ